MIGKHASKLEVAKSLDFNVTSTDDGEIPAASFSLVVDATGSPAGLTESLRLVEPRGTVVMKSTFREMAQFDTAKLVVDEITLLGSRCGNFSKAIDLMRRRRVETKPLVSKRFPLEAGLEAFRSLNDPTCFKILLAPRQNGKAAS